MTDFVLTVNGDRASTIGWTRDYTISVYDCDYEIPVVASSSPIYVLLGET